MIGFITWGSKWEYKVKEDGLRVDKLCPECDMRGEFFEVIPTKYFTIFWIPIKSTETKKPLLECPHCHERFYIQQPDYVSGIKNLSKPKINKPTVIHLPQAETDYRDICITQCRNCDHKLRVPKNDKMLRITCPLCNNSFILRNGEYI